MMPPTSIDGTDITGATIDGQDVQEITVDGQTVFSAGPNLPVAYSNLIAWWPFDSATYGGANADDVTAIIGGSGDDTAYDGTVSGPSYQSSGGVKDINAGNDSGAFSFDGNNDIISISNIFNETSHTKMCWFKTNTANVYQQVIGGYAPGSGKYTHLRVNNGTIAYIFDDGSTSFDQIISSSIVAGDWIHVAITYDATTSSNNCEMFIDGGNVGTASKGSGLQVLGDFNEAIGADPRESDIYFDGLIDDVRYYNTPLNNTQINQIISNTPHP